MREIPLTQGRVALVDDADYERVSAWKWQYLHNAKARTGYAIHMLSRGRGGVLMHRLLMGAGRGQQVDHRNRDGLDNRRGNLRLATSSQQSANTGKHRDAQTSRYKGVYLSRSGTWVARLGVQRTMCSLGSYAREIDAACAYNAAAREVFGEYAALNMVRLEAPR